MDTNRPLILKLVLFYFLAAGVFGLAWPFLGIGSERLEFSAQSASYKAGACFTHAIVAAGYIVAALAITHRLSWAFRLTVYVLVISALQSAKGFAWGFSQGQPSTVVYVFSLLTFTAWHILLGYVVYRNLNKPGSMPYSA